MKSADLGGWAAEGCVCEMVVVLGSRAAMHAASGARRSTEVFEAMVWVPTIDNSFYNTLSIVTIKAVGCPKRSKEENCGVAEY